MSRFVGDPRPWRGISVENRRNLSRQEGTANLFPKPSILDLPNDFPRPAILDQPSVFSKDRGDHINVDEDFTKFTTQAEVHTRPLSTPAVCSSTQATPSDLLTVSPSFSNVSLPNVVVEEIEVVSAEDVLIQIDEPEYEGGFEASDSDGEEAHTSPNSQESDLEHEQMPVQEPMPEPEPRSEPQPTTKSVSKPDLSNGSETQPLLSSSRQDLKSYGSFGPQIPDAKLEDTGCLRKWWEAAKNGKVHKICAFGTLATLIWVCLLISQYFDVHGPATWWFVITIGILVSGLITYCTIDVREDNLEDEYYDAYEKYLVT